MAKHVEEAVEEVAAGKPDKEAVEAKTNLLKRAAENRRKAMPIVTTIALNLVIT